MRTIVSKREVLLKAGDREDNKGDYKPFPPMKRRHSLHACTSDPKIKFQILVYVKLSYLSEKPQEA